MCIDPLAADRIEKSMKQLTGLGKTIIATDPDRIRLDQAVKNILAYKPMLIFYLDLYGDCAEKSEFN